MSLIDFITSHIPGVQNVVDQIDTIRAQFLAIPQQTQTNKAALAFARSHTNDASEVAALTQLQQRAQAVDSGFQSVVAQFSGFDDLRRSGASVTQIATAAAALLASANAVRSQSDALTRAVVPIAAKYGQPAPSAGGAAGMGSGLVILGVAGVAMLFVLGRQKRGQRGRRRR